MKPLSILKVAFATLLLFLFTSFSNTKEHRISKQNTHYYFYLDNGTDFDGWYTTSQEIARLEEMYGVYVDGSSQGGTCIASGYAIKGYPHTIYASVLLYTH